MSGLSRITVLATLWSAAVAFGAAPVGAQVVTGADPNVRTIRVAGVGEVQAQPNRATANFGVETTGETAEAAAVANAERMDRVIRALLAAGVQRSDIQTSGYSLYPEYAREQMARPEPMSPTIIGYRAVNQVSVRTRDLEGIGALIDAALTAGANRLHGVGFEVADEAADAAETEALTRAVQNARSAAETMARALGVQLGPVLDASTASQPIVPLYHAADVRMEMAQAAVPPPTPIEAGEQTVRATASLVFRIQ